MDSKYHEGVNSKPESDAMNSNAPMSMAIQANIQGPPGARPHLLSNTTHRSSLGSARSPLAAQEDVRIDFTLPPLISALNTSWQRSLSSATTMSALLVIVATQFLILAKSSVEPLADTTSASALMALIYSAIFFNIGATVASFVLTDRLSDMALFASQKGADPPTRGYTPYTNSLLQLYGLGRAWRWLIFHWLISFNAGIYSLIAAFVLYIWLQEVLVIRVLLLCFSTFVVLPTLVTLGVYRRW